MGKLLTLCVPTYNMEKYLARCLDSILCDNKEYLDVIIVNDGSRDRSSEIGHLYENKYSNVIRVIDKENGNYGTCVNRGLIEARGKYFRMLDADDWCDTEALNKFIEELKQCDADMVLTISEDRDVNNLLQWRMKAPELVKVKKVYQNYEFDGIKLEYNDLFCSHIVTYKTELLRSIKLHLQPGISYTDNEYVFFPLDKVQTIVYFDFPVYQYFVGREGQTTDLKTMAKSVGQIMQVFNRLWEYFIIHKDKQMPSVANNQRILLGEVMWWVYRAAFSGANPRKMQPIVDDIESRLQIDAGLRERVKRYKCYRYGLDLLEYYRKTGRYINHPITKSILIRNRVLRYVRRKIGLR